MVAHHAKRNGQQVRKSSFLGTSRFAQMAALLVKELKVNFPTLFRTDRERDGAPRASLDRSRGFRARGVIGFAVRLRVYVPCR